MARWNHRHNKYNRRNEKKLWGNRFITSYQYCTTTTPIFLTRLDYEYEVQERGVKLLMKMIAYQAILDNDEEWLKKNCVNFLGYEYDIILMRRHIKSTRNMLLREIRKIK